MKNFKRQTCDANGRAKPASYAGRGVAGRFLFSLLPLSMVCSMNLSAKAADPKAAPSSEAKSTKSLDLKTEEQKVSYAIGQQVGKSLKGQGFQLDMDVLAVAIKDAFHDGKSQMSEEDMRSVLQKLQETSQKKQAEEGKKTKEVGDKFLAENKQKKGVMTTASGLQYEVIKEGKGALPTETSKVKVHYKGTLINGDEFDSSYKRNSPAEFNVNQVIPGWTEALKMMKVGSVWDLAIPSQLAYGPNGAGSIPPNSVLKFRVELLELVK
ncbi:MAG: FKBP-type peptidyl-prolyl cis-trans isomerase [Oligoflexales bacterium]|nr:FKBP-type peptidyl-prolyl cis-trans isomerase [Oligoflexales bacterium]